MNGLSDVQPQEEILEPSPSDYEGDTPQPFEGGDDTADAGGESPDPGEPQAPAYNRFEEAAMKQGWVPQDQYTGDPAKWKPAEEWILGTQERLEQRLKKLEEKNQSLERKVKQTSKQAQATQKSTVQDRLEQVKKQFKKAVSEGDEEETERLYTERMKLEREAEAPPEEPDEPPADVSPEVQSWVERNPWFHTDPDLREMAMAVNDRCVKQGLSENDILAEVDRVMAPALRGKNMNPGSNPPSPAKAAGTPTRTVNDVPQGHRVQPKASLYNQLPADAKRVCDSDMRDPQIRAAYKDNDGWAKAYFEQEA